MGIMKKGYNGERGMHLYGCGLENATLDTLKVDYQY